MTDVEAPGWTAPGPVAGLCFLVHHDEDAAYNHADQRDRLEYFHARSMAQITGACHLDSLQIDLDLVLDVEYRVVENPRSGRLYPIDIVSVMHRGKDIYSSLHVDHVLTLQRRVYLRLVDDPHSGLLVK